MKRNTAAVLLAASDDDSPSTRRLSKFDLDAALAKMERAAHDETCTLSLTPEEHARIMATAFARPARPYDPDEEITLDVTTPRPPPPEESGTVPKWTPPAALRPCDLGFDIDSAALSLVPISEDAPPSPDRISYSSMPSDPCPPTLRVPERPHRGLVLGLWSVAVAMIAWCTYLVAP